MKSRRQNVSEDRLTISRREKRSMTLLNRRGNSLPIIPIDLIIDIFLMLPFKCIARCRCVSKLWASILRRPDFTDLYLKNSSSRPKLLLACQKNRGLIFFSAPQPQPQNPDDLSFSSSVATSYHMRFPLGSSFDIISPNNGFVLIRDKQILKGRRNQELVWVICNPSTGQSLTLPKPMTRKNISIRSYLGYDPIEKQFKVLSVTLSEDNMSKEHQVLTLGTDEKPSWRMIECGIPHIPSCDAVCIDGVFYYRGYMEKHVIICFHVRSEKFSFIKLFDIPVLGYSTGVLINYNGILASLKSSEHTSISRRDSRFHDFITGTTKSIKLWILQDPEKHEWSKHVYELPILWKIVTEDYCLLFVGVIGGTNELVLSPRYPSQPFYVFYYNLETRAIRRVEIQGAFKELTIHKSCDHVYIFLDHVEDVKLMPAF